MSAPVQLHLDDALWGEILRGGGTPEQRAHLGDACEECEVFLAARERADAMDGRVDALLLVELPRAAKEAAAAATGVSEVSDKIPPRVGHAGPLDLVKGKRVQGVAPLWSRRRTLAAAGAALALAAGMVLVLRPATEEEHWTAKGTSAGAAPLRIRYLVASVAPEAAALERGADGGRYGRDRALVFRVEAGGPGYLYLVRVARSEAERVWPTPGRADAHVDGGAFDFTESGKPTAYPLRDLRGPQRFAAVLSPDPLALERLARLARSLPFEMKAIGGAATEDGISVDAVDLVVEP